MYSHMVADHPVLAFLAIIEALILIFGIFVVPVIYLILPVMGAWSTAVRRATPGGEQWRRRNRGIPSA